MQVLEGIGAKTPVECLALFRHFMVDIVVLSSYGQRLGALRNWAAGIEDTLATAISDFPIRGVLVSNIFLRFTTPYRPLWDPA